MLFGTKKEKVTVINTKTELVEAIRRRDPCIKVQGDLAKKVKRLVTLSPAKNKSIAGALAASAFFGTAALPSQAALAALTGKDIAIVILALGVPIAVIVAILTGYDIEIRRDSIILTKK